MISSHQNVSNTTRQQLANAGGTNLKVGEIEESMIGSERMFTNDLQSDWTKPSANLSELQMLFDSWMY